MYDKPQRKVYLRDFKDGRQKEALKQALDIRKFEIELYWKRAGYFWTFIAAAFAGYFALGRDGDIVSTYVVTCLGFLFSLAWYFVNRGSGAWQRNWEAHVDLLEDGIMGPLYKTTLNRGKYKIYHLAEPFSFSPTRIHNILALSVTTVWILLLVQAGLKAGVLCPPSSYLAVTMSGLTMIAAVFLFWKGRSSISSEVVKEVERHVRKYL